MSRCTGILQWRFFWKFMQVQCKVAGNFCRHVSRFPGAWMFMGRDLPALWMCKAISGCLPADPGRALIDLCFASWHLAFWCFRVWKHVIKISIGRAGLSRRAKMQNKRSRPFNDLPPEHLHVHLLTVYRLKPDWQPPRARNS